MAPAEESPANRGPGSNRGPPSRSTGTGPHCSRQSNPRGCMPSLEAHPTAYSTTPCRCPPGTCPPPERGLPARACATPKALALWTGVQQPWQALPEGSWSLSLVSLGCVIVCYVADKLTTYSLHLHTYPHTNTRKTTLTRHLVASAAHAICCCSWDRCSCVD